VSVPNTGGGNSWSVFVERLAAVTEATGAVAGVLELATASGSEDGSDIVDSELVGVGIGLTGVAEAGIDEPGSSTEDATGEATVPVDFGTNDSTAGREIALPIC